MPHIPQPSQFASMTGVPGEISSQAVRGPARPQRRVKPEHNPITPRISPFKFTVNPDSVYETLYGKKPKKDDTGAIVESQDPGNLVRPASRGIPTAG